MQILAYDAWKEGPWSNLRSHVRTTSDKGFEYPLPPKVWVPQPPKEGGGGWLILRLAQLTFCCPGPQRRREAWFSGSLTACVPTLQCILLPGPRRLPRGKKDLCTARDTG